MKPPFMLIVLDGWGWRDETAGNAVRMAKTPRWDKLLANSPCTFLIPCGEAVGLPEGTMGNSEVGHMNIGAGRIVYQDLTRISKSIRDKTFFANPVLRDLMQTVKQSTGRLHLMGLVSDGGVHSHVDHLQALIRMAKDARVPEVWLHAFMDGRDTSPTSGRNFLKQIPEKNIATVIGRYFAMDRDKRWDRIEQAYRAMVLGEGEKPASVDAIFEKYYQPGSSPVGVGDEFIPPQVLGARIQSGDGVLFFNFRADRAREISRALTETDFKEFVRPSAPKLAAFVTMTRYEKDFPYPVAFPPQDLSHVFGEVVSQRGLKQFRIAETEKYAHVTYFFNGGREVAFAGEDRQMIPSPRDVATYDLKPEMSAIAVTEEVLKRLDSKKYDVGILNFANPDMVGHTGNVAAAIRACETVDGCLGRILDKLSSLGGSALITADHGNAEQMINADGSPHTSHTLNKVPLVLFSSNGKIKFQREGVLGDLAPTMLQLLGIPQPPEMTGASLISFA